MDTMDTTDTTDTTTIVTMETSNSQDDNTVDDQPIISPQWKFNIHLDKIGQALSDDDLTRMKSFCTGGDIGRAALNKATSPCMFFKLLEDMEFLNCNNLLHLQAMLWHIGRKDLHKDMVEFARECRKQPLHFFSPKEKPANGYRNVKFHIGGSEANRQEVENLRGVVAELLCVKPENVFLTGVEPSNSIVITFMIPEEAISVLFELWPEDRGILKSVNVDYIFVDEEEIPIVGKKMQKPTTISETKNVTKILRERNKLKSDVERLQLLLLERSEELRQAKRSEEHNRWSRDQAMMAFFTLLYIHRPATRIIDSLVSKSALVYFRHCLQQFQAKFPDEMDTIEILLEAKELVACKTERDVWKQHTEELRLLNEIKTNEINILNVMQIANLQDMHHVTRPSRLRLSGQLIRQISGTMEISAMVAQSGQPTGDIPFPQSRSILQQQFTFEQIQVIEAAEKVSKMINFEQRRVILRHFGVDKSKEKCYLDPVECFLWQLFQMEQRRNTLLEFIEDTIRILDDKQLDEKVHKIVLEVLQSCDKHTKDQQSLLQAHQVWFAEGKEKRPVSADVLQRLQENPEKLQECLTILQDLADVVQL